MSIINGGIVEINKLALEGESGNKFKAIAIGTGTTAGVSTLQTEIETNGGARRSGVNVTRTLEQDDFADDTMKLVTTFEFSGPLAVSEAGVFNHDDKDQGVMLCYQTFDVINVVNGDELELSFEIVSSEE